MGTEPAIRPRDRDAILQSLSAGVVPRRGIQHIQVGRASEVAALIKDIERIESGGAAIRFVIGDYGSGKSFFLHLVRAIATQKNLVTMHADLNPDRRLLGSNGQARSLYTEFARNASTRSNPDGGAIGAIVERFISNTIQAAEKSGTPVDTALERELLPIEELVGGYDFRDVIRAYWRGHDQGLTDLKASAVRWLRGEYGTRTEARQDLGVRTIIDDDNVYDQIKLLSTFVVLAGYKGLLVGLDELVNLYKLANTKARTGNYEQILRIVNDCLQGGVAHLGFVFAGTPEFLTDTRRGLYSYEALQSRLQESSFATSGLRDFSGPVIRLPSLTPEELYVLLTKLRALFPGRPDGSPFVPDEALHAFMLHSSKRLGDSYFRTPRTTIRSFIQLLSLLEQNPDATWQQVLGNIAIEHDQGGLADKAVESDDELTSFRL
jgi:hypothetical protein